MQDPSLRDFSIKNPLELAAKRGYSKVIEYLSGVGLECKVSDPNLRLNHDVDLNKEGQIVAAVYADNIDELKDKYQNYVRNANGYISLPEFYEFTLAGLAASQLSPKCLE